MTDYVTAPVGEPAGCFDTGLMYVRAQPGGSAMQTTIFSKLMTKNAGDLTFMVPNEKLDADPAIRDDFFGTKES